MTAQPRRMWTVVALMCLLSAMSYMDRTIISIAGPSILKELKLSETALGSVYSISIFSYTLCMTAGGWLADRFGGRLVLTLSGLLTALFTGITGLCGSILQFRTVRFLFGAAASPLYPSTGRVAANWVPPHRQATVQSLIMGCSAIGSATSPILFSWLIGRLGWREPFWAAALITAAVFLAWYAVVRDYPPDWGPRKASKERDHKTSWKALTRDPDMLLLAAGYFCINYFEYIFFYWIYFYFGEVRKFSAADSARYTSVLFMVMTIMTPIGGWISDRAAARMGTSGGRRMVAMAGMVLSAVLMYAGANATGAIATVAMLALALGCAAMAEGPFWATTIVVAKDNVGAGCGLLNTCGNLGGMIAPMLTPLIAARFGWSGGLYFACFVVLISAATWWWIHPEGGELPR